MKEDKKLLKKIAAKYYLDLLLLFGSRVSGNTHRESDFDVAYLSRKNLNLAQESKLIVDLMPVFQNEDIDLVNIKKANPLLLYSITKNCRVLYENKKLIFAFLRAYSFKKYVETKPLYENEIRKIKKELASL